MSEKLVTKGIVLRATATKEADYILNILTDSLGRIAVVARGGAAQGKPHRRGQRASGLFRARTLSARELVLPRRGVDDLAVRRYPAGH